MQKVKRQVKAAPALEFKNLKVEINQLVEKALKKAIKRIDALEKTVAKLKGTKKSAKTDGAKKVKSPLKGKVKKTRRSKKQMAA